MPLFVPVPAASTTVPGVVELATDAETLTGTDATRAVTPAGFTARVEVVGAAVYAAGPKTAGKLYAVVGA